VRARVSKDKFEKDRPSLRLKSEADSKSRDSEIVATVISLELREREPPLPKGEE